MCGRASQKGTKEDFTNNIYGFSPGADLNYPNIKPTQNMAVVVNEGNEKKKNETRGGGEKGGRRGFNKKIWAFKTRGE